MFRDKPQEHPLSKQLGHVSYAEPAHQIKPVDFNRADTDIQLFADFPVRVTLSHEAKNFFLTGRQRERLFGLFLELPLLSRVPDLALAITLAPSFASHLANEDGCE